MKTEKTIGIVIILGLIFKFMHFAGGAVILVLAFSALALIYFPLSFYFFSYKGLNNQKIALSLLGGLCLSAAIIGIMFKLLYWTGAGVMLLTGLAGSVVVLILAYTIEGIKATPAGIPAGHNSGAPNIPDLETASGESQASLMRGYYRNMKIRSTIITSMALVMFITPTSALIKMQHHGDAEMIRLKTRAIENPSNEQYRKEYHDYLQKKEPVKKKE